jgi:protein tyrosine/serine phosphatase
VTDSRKLDWPGFHNARTLAGLPTADGPIEAGRLFRSDQPHGDAATTMAVLLRAGVVAVIDLRSSGELELRPSVLAGTSVYRVSSLIDAQVARAVDLFEEKTLLGVYRRSLDRNGGTIVAALRAVVDAPPGGVLVHCAAGKDRTGMLVAMVLALAGTPDEDIIADYVETDRNLTGYYAAELASMTDPVERDLLATYQHTRAETMAGMLQYLRTAFGGVRTYVRERGLSDDDVRRLVGRLTSASP